MKTTTASFNILLLFLIFFSANAINAQTSCTPASAAAGSLDTCFGTGGKVTTGFGISPIMYDAAVQPDGKIIVVGASDYTAQNDFAVVRYNTDGSLDTTFDGDGRVSTDFEFNWDEAKSVKIQPDGKIVVAGRSSQFFSAARYNPDGSLDTSFDGDGKVLTDVGSATTNVGSVMTIQSDGKIVLAGYRQLSSGALWTSFVVRYNPDGSLDPNFDGDGKAEITEINLIGSIAQQADGKLLFGGVMQDSKMVVARLTRTGGRDTSFGTNGLAIYSPSNATGTAYALAVEANGKILAAGVMRPFNSNNYVGVIVRFSASGAVDSGFTPPDQAYSIIKDIYIQPDGKILTAGFNQFETARKGFEIRRFNDVGVPDSSFNGSGSLRLDFTEGNPADGVSYAFALGMTSDHKIVAAGVTQQDMYVNSGKIAVTRIMSGLDAQNCSPVRTAAGELDTCFGNGGRVTTKISAGLDWARGVAVQADEKIVVVGASDQSGASDFGVVRYNPDGSLDTTFDGDGKLTTDFGGRVDLAMDVKIQTDGKIVVSGSSSGFFAAARYNPDGSLDATFDGDGKVLTDIGAPPLPPNYWLFNSLEIQTDGKIVLAGGGSEGVQIGLHVLRYNQDGSLDNSFDGDGKVLINQIAYGKGVVIQPDGKILAAGGTNSKLAVARLNANGSPDAAFGTKGVAIFSDSTRFDDAFTLVLERNGKILAAGSSRPSQGGMPCSLFVRFDAGGTVDSNSLNCNSLISGLYIQPDGKILTAGFDINNASTGFQVIRYNDIGILDNTFNNGGILRVGFQDGMGQSTAYAVTMQRDNKIVAVGMAQEEFGNIPPGRFAAVRIMSGLAAPRVVPFDFDGDGKSDVSVFRPSNNVWYQVKSSNNEVSTRQFGLAGDIPAAADYDGDGKTDLAIFRPSSGDWWFSNSGSGGFNTLHWGQAGDIPRPADFDGDGRADFIVYRPSDNVWYRFGSTGAVSITAFGSNGDKPLIGDFDGDGKADNAVYRPSTGDWWWQSSADNTIRVTHWGISADTPAAGDFDGDGKTDFAVYRGGIWYILKSSNAQTAIINFGLGEDKPVVADYDGDGKADVAVFRPSNGIWYLMQSTDGFAAAQFGVSTDIAVPNAFVP